MATVKGPVVNEIRGEEKEDVEIFWALQKCSSLKIMGMSCKTQVTATRAQRVPEPDPLPGILFDTRPDPIQF